jgi:hypothetical protein
MAFNALCNVSPLSAERARIRATVVRYLDEAIAAATLTRLLPPDDAAPELWEECQGDLAAVSNDQLAAPARLAAMMVLVRQLHCSIARGDANPQNERDNRLVAWGLRVLEVVVPALEAAMARRA